MNYDAFSHGQMKSKLWLVQKLEPYLIDENIVVLGSWYNTTALVLKCRNYNGKIYGIDIDPDVKSIADKICDQWVIEGSVVNITGDASNIPVSYDTVINCSSEHMTTEWFDNIKPGTLVCIQSSNVTESGDPWYIKTASPDIDSFKQKYNLSKTLFCDTLRIQYDNWGYDRYMLIGVK
jgi:SAM-dependent methyltransferase